MKKTNEASKQTGISKRTLQYYDETGLIVVERNANNHRIYDTKVLERVWEILVYKEMHLELKEIKQLLLLSEEQKEEFLNQRMEILQKEIMDIEVQMGFISLLEKHGMPAVPSEETGLTFTECIMKLKEKIRIEITKNEGGNDRGKTK